MIALSHYLIVSSLLFCIGMVGVCRNAKNALMILMSIELMLLAVNINLVVFSHVLQNLSGQIFSLFVLTTAAAEAAIGLAILVVYFSGRRNVNTSEQQVLKG